MDFTLTDEQSILRDSVAAYLRDNYDFETRRRVGSTDPGWQPAVWKALAEELGILGVGFPEAQGGLGGGSVEFGLIMEEFGRALVIEPYLETVIIGGRLLQRSGYADDELVAKIIRGEAVLAFAYAEHQARYTWRDVRTSARPREGGYVLDGQKAVVIAAPLASHLLVTARTSGGPREPEGISLFLVDRNATGVATRDYRTVDGRRASEVTLENVWAPPEALVGTRDHALPIVERVIDEATAAVCAEACGVLRKLHEGTVDYTKQRRQFGVPIATFQVLQHRMVDMFIQLEQAVSMSAMATLKLREHDIERAKAVSAAKVQIGKACKFIGHNAIQLHGGMGMTDELSIGHYFKRAIMIESQFGSTDHHLARYERLAFPPANEADGV
jgi:alkylation response protein AidB-like acyl-CoA dehydrogenase